MLEELKAPDCCRTLCWHCRVPLCIECRKGLGRYEGTSSVPMPLCNDTYYGYVLRLLAQGQVTWLECAAASL